MTATALPLAAQTSIAAAVAAHGLAALPATKSSDAVIPPATLEDVLHGMFRQADVVFTGEVAEVKRGEGSVVVSWRVEDAVRGLEPGGVYDLREWAGLWDGNGVRYMVGERALVMLHAPSIAGFASPVSGDRGVIPLRGKGVNSVLDLRLLAQGVAVQDVARLRPAQAHKIAGGSLVASDALQACAVVFVSSRQAQPKRAAPFQRAPEEDTTAVTGVASPSANTAPMPSFDANSSVDGAMILGMLHAWQRGKDAAQ